MKDSTAWALTTLGSVLLVTLYGGAVIGLLVLLRKRRKTRWPFKEDDRLLRSPGETLRRKWIELQEAFAFEFFGGIIVTLGVCWLGAKLSAAGFFSGDARFGFVALIAGLASAFSLWRISKLWRRASNNRLGWFGERMVGEQLDKAAIEGWRAFHDVPFSKDGKNFNIDHVLVGPRGVFVVETKTRRKGNARPGFKDHEVIFDGRQLIWALG